MRTIINLLIYFGLFSIFYLSSAIAQTKYDFFQLSNVENALDEGDCEIFGGYRYNGDVAELSVLLSKRGRRVGTYNNVKSYNGNTYVLWGYRSGIIFVSTTLEWCVFK